MTDVTTKRHYQAPTLVVHGSIAGLTRQTQPVPTPTPTITPTPPGPSVIGANFESIDANDIGTSL